MIWEVLESNRAGLHRFRLRRWPTDVRYEADTLDGYTSPGGEVDLANSLRVYWTTLAGTRPRRTTRPGAGPEPVGRSGTPKPSSSVPRSAPRPRPTRSVPRSSPRSTSSLTPAPSPWLDRSGTCTWAGWCSRGRSSPATWSTSATSTRRRCGSTEMTYRDSDLSATLTLGTPTYSTDELVAKLATRRHRRGAVTPNALGHQK